MSNQVNARDISVAGLTALQVTQYARAQAWERAADQGLDDPPAHYGPLADELYAIDPNLAVRLSEQPGDLALDLATVAGLAWAAAAIAGDQIAALTVRVTELERQLAELL